MRDCYTIAQLVRQVPGMSEVILIGNVDQADISSFIARVSRQCGIRIRYVLHRLASLKGKLWCYADI